MSRPSITFFSDPPSKQPNNLPSEIPSELIEFIGQKILEAGYENLQELAKAFGTKNPNKLVRALQEFGKTGSLNPNYMRELSKFLSFKMSEVEEIIDRHYDVLNKELNLCAANISLILKNTDRIIENTIFRNITFRGMAIKTAHVRRQRPLTLGEVVFLWKHTYLIAQGDCCGPVYIYGMSGSPLSGSHQYRGICSVCKELVYDSLPTFTEIWHPLFHSEFPYEYEPTDFSIEKLVQELS